MCGDICPVGAISYLADEEGFLYPEVDGSKCTDCGLCEKVCPCLNKSGAPLENSGTPKCYAAEHKSTSVVFSSTSGGMFTALAEVMYAEKGFVGGAVHNEDFSVSQFISNDKNDLRKLRRSKDLQSNSEGFYKKVKDILDGGEKVLVCSLPCQTYALYQYLGKEYDNLLTVDLVCAGVNSPKVWRKYLDLIEEKAGSKIVSTENKSKEYGWKNLTQKFVFENGEEYFDTVKTSLFTKGFIESHLYLRPSCYECMFKGFPRIADITIGDFWGIEKYDRKADRDLGTSLVLINSGKGEEYFEKVKSRIVFKEVPLSVALSGNPALSKPIAKLPDNRKEFFEDLEKCGFEETVQKYGIRDKKSKGIRKMLRTIYSVIKHTRLHPYSLYQTIKYSGLKNLCSGKGIICGTNSHLNIDKSAKLEFEGLLILGRKEKFPKSREESKLFMGKDSKLKILGDFAIDASGEIIIFDEAKLIIHGGKIGYSDANSGLRIICGSRIEIMPDAGLGRNVSIRDTNGNLHYMNTPGYRPSRPVLIGEKAWLCDSCSVMPGVSIGRGAVIGGGAFVIKSVPDHAMVLGNPAEIVSENVLFKL